MCCTHEYRYLVRTASAFSRALQLLQKTGAVSASIRVAGEAVHLGSDSQRGRDRRKFYVKRDCCRNSFAGMASQKGMRRLGVAILISRSRLSDLWSPIQVRGRESMKTLPVGPISGTGGTLNRVGDTLLGLLWRRVLSSSAMPGTSDGPDLLSAFSRQRIARIRGRRDISSSPRACL